MTRWWTVIIAGIMGITECDGGDKRNGGGSVALREIDRNEYHHTNAVFFQFHHQPRVSPLWIPNASHFLLFYVVMFSGCLRS